MKTFPILEKRPTWILLAASLLLPPALIITWPRRPIVERFTRIYARVTGEGPQRDVTPEILRLQSTAPLAKLTHVRELTDRAGTHAGPWLWRTPEMRPVARCLQEEFGSYLREYAALSRSGRVDWTRASQGSPGGLVHIIALERPLSALALALAQAEEGAGNLEASTAWAAAAVEVYHARVLSDYGNIGATFAGIQTTALAGILLADADTSSTRQSLLSSLEQVPFPFSPTPLTGEFLEGHSDQSSRLARAVQQSLAAQVVLADSAWALAHDQKHLTNPRNRAWAERLLPAGAQPGNHALNPLRGMVPAIPPWSLFPALEKQFSAIVSTEKNLLWQRVGGHQTFGGTDPIDAALYTYRIQSRKLYSEDGNDPMLRLLRTLATERNILRLAAAARTYRAAHGQWPESLGDLVPAWTELTASPAEITSPSLRSRLLTPGLLPLPLQVGRRPVTERDLPDLLGRRDDRNLIWHSRTVTPPQKTSDPDRLRYHLEVSIGDWNKFPLGAFAVADQISNFTNSALTTVTITAKGQPPVPLSRTEATSVTFAHLSRLPELCPSLVPPGRPTLPTGAVQVETVLELPRERFAVWSRGADPVDPEDDMVLFLRE